MLVVSQKIGSMKQIILFTIAIFITLTGSTQNNFRDSNKSNNPFLDEKQIGPELKIYPNPCKTEKITIDFNAHQIAEITISNITGKQVFKKKFDFAENKKQLQLNDIQNGIYLIKVKSVDNKTVVKKLIISKQ